MQSVRKHYDALLNDLKNQVMEMGLRAEKMVGDATKSLISMDESLARQVVDSDDLMDKMELEVQSTSLVIIAREAPVARDVRFIGAALSVSSELERVGDDAVSIAKKTISMPNEFPREYTDDILEISDKARAMLMNALKAFSTDDQDLLDAVIASDSEVDAIWKRVRRKLKEDIKTNPEFLETGFKLINACHHLEYVGDHAVSIAERLEFVRTGNIVRFSRAEFMPPNA